MTSTAINVETERDRARWERYARLINGAERLEAIARSSRVCELDAREYLSEAAELRGLARRVSS